MAKNKYQDLHLDSDNIELWIHEYCNNHFKGDYELSGPKVLNTNNNQNRYTIDIKHGKIEVDFYLKKNKKTTVKCVDSGPLREHSLRIADYICEKAEYKDVHQSDYRMTLSKENFKLIIEYLTELKEEGVQLCNCKINETQKSEMYQYISRIGDRITLTYYNSTNTFLFQGKAMKLYQEVNCLLSGLTSGVELIKKEAQFFKVPIKHEEINEDIKNYLPKAHAALDQTYLNILSASLVYKKIDIPLKDYSSFTFPALRALEGYIRMLFSKHGISINNKLGFSYIDASTGSKKPYFVFDKTKGIHVLESGQTFIACPNTCKALEQSYSYFVKHRHTLFHTESIAPATRLIEKREEADIIIDTVLDIIERTYGYII